MLDAKAVPPVDDVNHWIVSPVAPVACKTASVSSWQNNWFALAVGAFGATIAVTVTSAVLLQIPLETFTLYVVVSVKFETINEDEFELFIGVKVLWLAGLNSHEKVFWAAIFAPEIKAQVKPP